MPQDGHAPKTRLVPALAFWLTTAIFVAPIYFQQPWLGDDLDYWSFAIHHHDPEVGQPLNKGFHALRWPVWGVIWLFQHILPKGLPSYYAQPVFYFALGTAVMLLWAREIFPWSWRRQSLAMVLYLFHPLLGPVLHRPMPDLSEGVFMAGALLAFWRVLRAETFSRSVPYAVLCGLLIQLAFANRFTGLLIVPVMVLCTLSVHPRRMMRLLPVATASLVFFLIECSVYFAVHGNFLHSLTANASGRGRPGTEPVPLWWFPFRFFDTLWKGNVLKIFFTATALAGILFAMRSKERVTRLSAFWAIWLYLGYSCAIQSVDPLRPLIRDGERFIASLAWPLTLMSVSGIFSLVAGFQEKLPWRNFSLKHTRVALLVLALPLGLSSGRKFFYGFDPELNTYIESTLDNSRIVSHSGMRDLCALVNYEKTKRFQWNIIDKWLEGEKRVADALAAADLLWVRHKELWLARRKTLEQEPENEEYSPPPYALNPPVMFPERVIALNERPDLWFFNMRHPPGPLSEVSLDGVPREFFTELQKPLRWRMSLTIPRTELERPGVIGVYLRASASRVHPLDVDVEFFAGQKKIAARQPLLYINPMPADDAIFCDVPPGADSLRLTVRSRASKGWVAVEFVRAYVR